MPDQNLDAETRQSETDQRAIELGLCKPTIRFGGRDRDGKKRSAWLRGGMREFISTKGREMAINAEEARKLASRNRNVSVERFTNAIDEQVTLVATCGGFCLDPRQHIASLRINKPSINQWHLIREHYESRGFKWEEFHDQREQASSTKLSW